MTSTYDLRQAAREIESSWGAGGAAVWPENDQVCIIGACARTSEKNYSSNHRFTASDIYNDFDQTYEAKVIRDIIKEQYPELEEAYSPSNCAVRFNDRLANDAAEVAAVLEKAAAKMEEKV